MMKILFLSRWFPYPADNGAKKRTYHLIDALSKSHVVDLISFTSEPVKEEHRAALKPICRSVDTFLYRPFQPKRLGAIMGAFASRPRFLVDTYHAGLAGLVQAKCQEEGYDLVIASELDMFPYIEDLNGPAIMLEEIEIAQYINRLTNQSPLLASLWARLTWWKLATYLKKLLPTASGSTTVSDKERTLIERFLSTKQTIVVIPNGASSQPPTATPQPPVPDTLIYAGALTYKANFDAVDYFIHHIFPLIKSKRPNVTFTVTGSLAGVDISALSDVEGVVFPGYLDDIAAKITSSWASVVPLRFGGGTRLKILESLSLGTPVVSTTKGMEGLDLIPGKEILVSDDPQGFAEQVICLLESEDLRASVGRAGRQAVEEKYDWQKIGATFSAYAEKIAGEKAASHGRSR